MLRCGAPEEGQAPPRLPLHLGGKRPLRQLPDLPGGAVVDPKPAGAPLHLEAQRPPGGGAPVDPLGGVEGEEEVVLPLLGQGPQEHELGGAEVLGLVGHHRAEAGQVPFLQGGAHPVADPAKGGGPLGAQGLPNPLEDLKKGLTLPGAQGGAPALAGKAPVGLPDVQAPGVGHLPLGEEETRAVGQALA